MFQRLLNNSFIRSSFIFAVTNFLVSVIAYIDNLLIAKNFTLAAYGEYMTALSYLVFFGVPLTAFGLIVVERIGRVPEKDRARIALSIEAWLQKELLRSAPILLVIGLILGSGMYFKGNMSLMAVTFVLITSFLGIFVNFYMSVLQAYKVFFSLGMMSMAGALFKLALYISVILIAPNLFWLFSMFIISTLFGYWFGRRMIRPKTQQKLTHIEFDDVYKYVKRRSILIPLFTTLGIVGLSNIDVVLVKKFFDSDVSGLYASLSVLGKIIFYAVTPLSAVAFTFFTGSETKYQSVKILTLITVFILGTGMALTGFYALFPVFVIKVVFSSQFLEVSNIIWLSAIFGTTYSLMYLYAQYFVALKSRFALLGILAVVIQIIAIYIVHESLYQVLVINILVNGGLVLIYMGEVLRRVYLSRLTR